MKDINIEDLKLIGATIPSRKEIIKIGAFNARDYDYWVRHTINGNHVYYSHQYNNFLLDTAGDVEAYIRPLLVCETDLTSLNLHRTDHVTLHKLVGSKDLHVTNFTVLTNHLLLCRSCLYDSLTEWPFNVNIEDSEIQNTLNIWFDKFICTEEEW